ncbi:MAG TPA: efflux RND transporter periplasmic adaptor subunit [Pirellulales bacterium]|jgi:membrane fusion protein (multidrug efflux system)|nr:efflux RND transporter periplasmic adaptor subunit [Pirellulales bacterium]
MWRPVTTLVSGRRLLWRLAGAREDVRGHLPVFDVPLLDPRLIRFATREVTNERNPMKVSPILAIILGLVCLSLSACAKHEEEHHEAHKITATSPESKSITLSQPYVCQIHSQRHIQVRALERGYLEAITIREGQQVKAGDLLFKVIPVLYQTRYEAENAEARVAQLEYEYANSLFHKNAISQNEVALVEAKMLKARAKAEQAKAELNFATVKAPFDGIVDRLHHQQGSLVEEGEILTTMSDNSLMWVYFNVPEARYLEYMTNLNRNKEDLKIELVLANQQTFNQSGKIGAIEADFNNQTGNIPFRADFLNPERLLRHGQTGTVVIRRVQNDAIVIPQRATFEVLQKRYVYVIDQDHVAHQREIEIQNELEDLFVLKKGLDVKDVIVLEGIRQVRDGDKVEFEDRQPEEVVANLKYHAE